METIVVTSLEQLPAAFTLLCAELAELKKQLLSNCSQNTALPPSRPEYLTRTEVRDLLKVSFPTITKWTLAGKLKGYRIGNLIKYKPDEVDACLKEISTTKNAAA